MKKRIASALMALILCLTLLPATALAEESTTVPKLDFRFDQPTVETQYTITDGGTAKGTAKWEPGNDSTPNKLTLNGVTMTDDSYVVAVPANTEIILIGTNKITATSTKALCAHNGTLKIIGEGSLEVTAPASASAYALYTNISGAIDVSIDGALTVNGNIRANEETLSLQSGDDISVCGSMYGKKSITANAGKSLSITNTSGTAVFASSCTEVSLAAQNGNLTVSGTGTNYAYGIDGDDSKTVLKLHASGNVLVTGTKASVHGETLELSGTIPENSTLTAYYVDSMTVPAGKTLINNGTIKLDKYPASVTVFGTLTNNGSIVDDKDAPIRPTVSGNGVITGQVAMDFTGTNTDATGEGYSWDYDSETLTLTGYKMTEPCNDSAIILPAGANLVLSGENTLNSKNGALIDAKGTLEISGTGSLTGSAGGEAALNAQGALTITDCKLDLTNPSHGKTVICTNGNALTITGSADVSLHTAADSGFGITTGDGGNLTLDSDAKLVITGATGILAKGASVRIAGTLDVSDCKNLGANLLGVTLNMEGSSITAATGVNQGIYLNGTLTGQTNIKSFTGVFKLTSSDSPIVNCYTVQKDDTLGLYAKGSTVTFTAKTIEGKPFASWRAIGVTLTDSTKATISFTMPGNNVTLTTAYTTSVNEVSLNKTELALTVGDTQTLTATITPDNANNKNVSWSSDKPSVATVDENGKVTAVAAGTANITVKTVDGEKTAVCTVTVTAKSSGGSSSGSSSAPTYPVTAPSKTENGSIAVSPKNAKKGTTVTITVTPDKGYTLETLTVLDKDGREIKLTKKNDTQYTFTMPASKVETKATFMDDNAMLNYFVDVKANDYFYDAVLWAAQKGITSGTDNEHFSPNQPCTRAQIVTFLWRAAGSPVVNYAMNMTDVPADAYYAEAVRWALSEGITTGTTKTTFSPDEICTRAQAVTFLCRSQKAAAEGGMAVREFTDFSSIPVYAVDAIQWALENHVTTGAGDGSFAPNAACTRAQIVTFLYRAMEK